MLVFAVFERSTSPLLAAVIGTLLCVTAGDLRADQETEMVRVAAVQAAGSDASKIDPTCRKTDTNCAVAALVRRAHAEGAELVVTPEYSLIQRRAEPAPEVGDLPTSHARSPLLTRFSRLARELEIYIALHLETKRGGNLFNTLTALGPDGKVVGVHHKFELFGSERDTHTPGESVMAFDTPFGRVGLLVCADVYGDPRLHDELTRNVGARIVALSTRWTVSGATRWQAAFARDWGVYVVAANASRGDGKGGGVFDPKGNALALDEAGTATVTVASIPVQR